MRRAVFIVSTGRTGTTFLADLFGRLGFRAHHEGGPRWLRNLSNAYVSGHLSDRLARRALRGRVPSAAGDSGEVYVEASCFLYGLVRPLLDSDPCWHVVQIIRDPRTFVRSGMNWGMYRFGGRPLNLLPFRRLAPPQFRPWSLSARLDWFRRDQFERLCWAWTHMNRAMREQGTGSDRFRILRFEDIFDRDRGHPGLLRLCELAGWQGERETIVELARSRVNETPRKRFPPWSEWPEDRRRIVREICAEEARVLGYEMEERADGPAGPAAGCLPPGLEGSVDS